MSKLLSNSIKPFPFGKLPATWLGTGRAGLILTLLALFLVLSYYHSQVQKSPAIAGRTSPDAIAIRVIPNHQHYSPMRWYKEQGFTGSPQSLIIDGYEAIRDGRTVYVNAANINDQGTPYSSDDVLYTNIYLMSYNQDAEPATIAIVNQLLQHWHFNTDLPDVGQCVDAEGNLGDVCLIDPECPTGEYCNSAKAKVTRDTIRMARMKDIDLLLEQYKTEHGHYLKLEAGTYVPRATISVWPSWQETLGQALGAELPIDPINRLADCAGYDPITCWNEQTHEFAWITGLNNPAGPVLPAGNYVFVYRYGSYNLCAGMETSYPNVAPFDCLLRVIDNNPPRITGANFVGLPKQEFIGYFSASDADEDTLTCNISLINPNNSNDWVNTYQWQWDGGESNFIIRSTAVPGHYEIYAAQAGNASVPGLYQVEITIDDNQGEINSVVSEIFDITIGSHAMTLDNDSRTIIIGQTLTLNLTGTDASLNPLIQLYFNSAALDGLPISLEAELNSHGFTIVGMDLFEAYPNNDIQQTGNYIINVYALDPTTNARVDSFFDVTIENNPPVINSLTANYVDGTNEICQPPNNCDFMIDNTEAASIQVDAIDNDLGHTAQYSLVNNPENALTIDVNTGVITGFENLNFQNLIEADYDVEVRVSDRYCANSQEAECSAAVIFTITVDKWCSVDTTDPGYVNALHRQTSTSFELYQGQTYPNDLMSALGFPAPPPAPGSCSKIGNASSTIIASGVTSDKAIVFVIDTSGSMNGQFLPPKCVNKGTFWWPDCQKTPAYYGDLTFWCIWDGSDCVPSLGPEPIDYAKTALIDTINDLHAKVQDLPEEVSINVGLIRFSSNVSYKDLGDISSVAHKNNLIDSVNGYSANGGTHTLNALNRAETMLLGSAANEKIVILLSDGVPTDTQSIGHCICFDACCPFCGCPCPAANRDPCKGCGGGSCFAKDTFITIADSSKKFIQDIKTGDKILAWDFKKQKAVPAKVGGTWSGPHSDMYIINSKIKVTSEHPFWTKESGWAAINPLQTFKKHGWAPSQLKVGQHLMDAHGNYTKIISIDSNYGEVTTYNLVDVQGYNNYFAENMLVHNKGPATYNNKSDFKIAVTVQTECLDSGCGNCAGACDDSDCDISPTTYCSYWSNPDCDISSNTATQAEALKNLDFTVYTIYYDTGSDSDADNMCDWSSDPDCPVGGTYAFNGDDIEALFESVIEGIFSKPEKPVEINNIDVPFDFIESELLEILYGWVGLDSYLSCTDNNVSLWVNDFPGGGAVTIENTEFDYCEPLLHP